MSASTAPVRLTVRRFGETARRDAWWIQPLVVFLGLSTFLVYSTWAAFQGDHYTYGPYLSPFYSPEIFGDSPHSWFGRKPGDVARVAAVFAGAADPADSRLLPVDLLLLPRRVLQGVLGRSAVVHGRRAALELLGREFVSAHPAERPSLHAVPVARGAAASCTSDVWKALWFTDPATGTVSFGIGVGTLVLATNCVLLERLPVRLSFAASCRRRLRRSAVARAAWASARTPA